MYKHADASGTAIGELWAQGKVLADTCNENLKEVGSLVGTAFTARDTMQIIDALDQGPLFNYYSKNC